MSVPSIKIAAKTTRILLLKVYNVELTKWYKQNL